MTVDAELRDALAGINASISDLSKVARSAESEAKEANYRAARLERAVFGSKPPPDVPPTFAEGGEAAATSPISATAPRPIALAARVGEESAARVKLEDRVGRIERMNEAQCKVMGVPTSPAGTDDDPAEPSAFDRLVAFALSREGRNLGLRVLTLVLAALAASHAGSADDSAKATAKVVQETPALATPPAVPYGAASGGVKP